MVAHQSEDECRQLREYSPEPKANAMMGVIAHRAMGDGSVDISADSRGSNSTKSEKRQITRNRTSYSCQACRKRKVKCDKTHPKCGACVRTGEECVYGKAEPAQSLRNEEPVDDRSFLGIAASSHGEKRRSTFDEQGRRSPPPQRTAESTLRRHGLDALEDQLRRLTAMVELLKRESPQSSNGPLTPTSSESNTESDAISRQSSHPPGTVYHTTVDDVDAVTKPIAELFLNTKTSLPNTQYKDTFWASVADELRQMQTTVKDVASFGDVGASLQLDPYVNRHLEDQAPNPSDEVARKRDRLAFHRYLPEQDPSGDNCSICAFLSSDKAALLLGPASDSLDNTLKLDLTKDLPTEAQSHVLFRSYLTGVQSVLPFLTLQSIFRKYRTFWQWKRKYDQDPASVIETPDIYFLAVLNSIWYAGSLSLSKQGIERWFGDSTRASICTLYHDQATRMLRLVSFPANNKVNMLGTFALLQAIPCTEEEPLQVSAYVNMLVRLAQSLGLHRESTYSSGGQYEAEMQRRKWWQISQLDLLWSTSSGNPPLISEDYTDTATISVLQEAHLNGKESRNDINGAIGGETPRLLPEPLSESRATISVFQVISKAQAIAGGAIRKVGHLHHCTKAMSKEDLFQMNRIVNDAEKQVQAVIKSLPSKGLPELGFIPPGAGSQSLSRLDLDDSLSQPLEDGEVAYYVGFHGPPISPNLARYHRQRLVAFYKWARIYLSMLCDKMHCVAYSPFLKNARSKLWTAARQCALHHCASFLRKFISLATDASLEPFRWSWPSMHQPMHATIIALVDTYERPHSTEAPRSRALIDQVFALSDPSVGIVGGPFGPSTQRPLHEGGSEAWNLLRGLRSAAWRKARLDPDVLWTEADQLTVGVARPLTKEQLIAQHLREDSLYDDTGATPNGTNDNTFVGIQHMLRTQQEDAHTTANLPPPPRTCTQAKAAVHAINSGGKSGLFRLEHQQAMPWPLDHHHDLKCPGPIAQVNGNMNGAREVEGMTSPYDQANRVIVEGTVGKGQLEIERRSVAGLAAAAAMAGQRERTIVDAVMLEGGENYGEMTAEITNAQQKTNDQYTGERASPDCGWESRRVLRCG